ncbi:MAG TPA: hypothetical protein VF534_01360 [Paraburkholderia sp.]
MGAPVFNIATYHPDAPGLHMLNTNGAGNPLAAEGRLWCTYDDVLNLIMQVQYSTRQQVTSELTQQPATPPARRRAKR